MEMYNRLDVSSWSGLENFATKNGRNVFAYRIKAQIEEHTRHRGDATLYNADQVAILTDALMNISARLMRGEHGEAVVLSGFFSPEEIYRILVAAHAILWQLYAKEYGTDALGGIFAALLQAFSIIMKETGAGISLGK